ncbi:MAG: DUF4386 domain-containing protein [bacterium]
MTQKRIIEATQRRAEIMVATLFITCAVVSIPAAFFLDPILNGPNYLAGIFPNKSAVVFGALLWSINNIGLVFIAVYMYPLLKKLDETVAAGYLSLRIIEGSVMMCGIAATLMLIPLSREFIEAGAPLNAAQQVLGDSLKQARFMGLTLVSLPILGLGGCIFTWQLIKFNLVPLPISVTGLVGYTLVFTFGVAAWFGVIDPTPTPGNPATLFAIPVALFEIILLPYWLFRWGFKMPEIMESKVAAQQIA